MCAAPQRLCGSGPEDVIRQFCIRTSAALSQVFLRCAAFWSDVAEALNNREALRKVRERRGKTNA